MKVTMGKSVIIYFVTIVSLVVGCNAKSDNNRSYFVPDEKRGLVIPVKVGDSIYANMLFDTGAHFDFLMLDSTYCAKHSLFEDIKDQGVRVQFCLSAWAFLPEYMRSRVCYKKPLVINAGGSDMYFNEFRVQDSKRDFAVDVDGMMGFPKNDTTHVWEFNFENDYLELHQTADFKMPDDCYVLPLVEGYWDGFPYVKFPMNVKNSHGDTITVHETYLIDTGLTQDMVVTTNSKSYDFFDKAEDVVLIESAAGYRGRNIVDAEMFNGVKLDSLRIYTDKFAYWMIKDGCAGILGMNFLKRFNLFFDFKNMQLGFQPTGKFERAVDPNVRKFYYSASFTKEQKYIVTMVANIKDNPFKEAGLLAGDEIVALGGVAIKDWPSSPQCKEWEKEKSGTQILDVKRNGEILQLTYQKLDDGWVGE